MVTTTAESQQKLRNKAGNDKDVANDDSPRESDENNTTKYSTRIKNASVLAAGYTAGKRRLEIASMTVFSILLVIANVRTTMHTWDFLANSHSRGGLLDYVQHAAVFIFSFILSMIVADFLSGMTHWLADTWGSVDTPVFSVFIRSFREHHVKPMQMTKHDIVETNGDNCLATIPIVIVCLLLSKPETLKEVIFANFFMELALWVAVTNQIHKLAHQNTVHPIIGFLQDYNIILSRSAHATHHKEPFDRDYCITNGWLNPLLTGIGFWTFLETVISAVTGAVPRADDHKWTGLADKQK